jgi:hypothetical protein
MAQRRLVAVRRQHRTGPVDQRAVLEAEGDAVAPLIAMHFAVGVVLIMGFAWCVGGRTAAHHDVRSEPAGSRQGTPQPR